MATVSAFAAGSAQAAPVTISGAVDVSADVTFTSALPLKAGYPLTFGVVTINKSPGMITMPTDSDIPTFSGGATSVSLQNARRGTFSFTAPNAGNASITFENQVPLYNLEYPSKTVYLSPAVSINNPVTSFKNELVQIFLGGTISFPANTTVGNYHGVVTVNVDWTGELL